MTPAAPASSSSAGPPADPPAIVRWLDARRPLSPSPPAPDRAARDDAFRPFGLSSVRVAGNAVPVTETIGGYLPFARLRRFARPAGGGAPRRVLVVAPMAGGFPFLMRDLVVALLSVADEVAITEWPDVRYLPLAAGRFGFAENCIETAQMIRALADSGEGSTHVVGVCQGAVPALVGALLLAEDARAPASLSLMGGPVDPSRNPTRLWRVLQERSLAALEQQIIETVPEPFAGAGRRVFPAWRQTDTFALYLWRQTMSGGHLPFRLAFDEGDDPFRYPLARLCWTLMDVPAEFFMENVATIFRANALARASLALDGRPVRLDALTRTALLTIEGEDDDISATTQTQAAHDLCRALPAGLHRHVSVPGAGHFDLFYGRLMHSFVIPAIDAAMRLGIAAQEGRPAS